MIKVYSNGLLYIKNKKYNCTIGKNGITENKREGDSCTPEGKYSIGPIFYRHDRISKMTTKIKSFRIKENMYWSDDPESKYYNKLIYFKDNSYESLYREDNIYDIVLVINYNTSPVQKYKGSAIFMHVANENFSSTKGCIALRISCLMEVLKVLKPKEKIHIINKKNF